MGSALCLQYEPLTYLKYFQIVRLKATIFEKDIAIDVKIY
jgi:hypothetical protein